MAKALTEYIVLYAADPEAEGQRQWVEAETRDARSARAAISGYVRERDITGGQFVAVPTRSFDIITAEIETQTRLKFS